MTIQYVLTSDEIAKARERLYDLKQTALMARDADDMEANREFYLRAKGFEECMALLGVKTGGNKRWKK